VAEIMCIAVVVNAIVVARHRKLEVARANAALRAGIQTS
jgi:hypothetical protein